jgi:uncharacterized protein YndB with AHSA1/START domain
MMAAMQLTHAAVYDAPLDQVFAMLTDPGFREYAAQRSGVLEVTVDVQPHGEGRTVRMDQVQPLQGVPAVAKKFAGDTTRAVVEEVWSSPASSTLVVETPGKPTRIEGSYTLVEMGGRTTQKFEGTCTVSVPLIGKKLEQVMGDLFVQARDAEATAGREWLQGTRP